MHANQPTWLGTEQSLNNQDGAKWNVYLQNRMGISRVESVHIKFMYIHTIRLIVKLCCFLAGF